MNPSKINNKIEKQVNFLEKSENKIISTSTFRPVGPNINSTFDVTGVKYSDEYSLVPNNDTPEVGNYGASRLTR